MSIVNHDDWSLSERGLRDAQRHRQKIDDQIRKNVKNVIGEESIITSKNGKKVRIPVRGLKDFQFRHGIEDDTKRGGVGQGKGKAGDVIARKPGQNGNDAGNEKGEEYMEVEVDIDYLIRIMFEDLGLPYLEEKTKVETLIPVGWKFEGITKVGPPPRLHKKKTITESLKRTAAYIAEIMDETKCEMDIAEKALVQAEGDLEEAILIVKESRVDANTDTSLLYIEDDDLRYKNISEQFEPQSNAVVIAIMDISGSMTPDKKYLSRSFLFWLVEFLKKTYKNVQIRFIVHTTDARLTDEESFFKKAEYGGTLCHTAFDLANYTLETEFPLEQWNRYVVYCSDGEDFEPDKTMQSTKNLLENGVNMLAYLEIKPTDTKYIYSTGVLLKEFKKKFDMKATTTDSKTFFKNDEKHFFAGEIKGRNYIYPALKTILFKKDNNNGKK
jgi:hypothetical protein